MKTISYAEVKNLIAAGHVVFGYPRRGEIVVNGFKRYKASMEAIRAAKSYEKQK